MPKTLGDTGYKEEVISVQDLVGQTLLVKAIGFGESRANGEYADLVVDRIVPETGEVLEGGVRVVAFAQQVRRVAKHLLRELGDSSGALGESIQVSVEREGDVVTLV